MYRTLVLLLVVAPTAFADTGDGINREAIRVGDTIEREVGYAIGVRCDHPDIVAAEMKPRSAETNILLLTGKNVGTTTCRAGTDPNRVSYVFEVTVTPRLPRR